MRIGKYFLGLLFFLWAQKEVSAQMFCCRIASPTAAPPPAAPENITFVGDGPQGIYEETDNVWAAVTVDAAYNHLGLGASYLPVGEEGYITALVDAATDGAGNDGCFIGLNFQNSQTAYNRAAIMVRPAIGFGYQIFVGASFIGLIGTCADGDTLKISVDRADQECTVWRKPIAGSWTSVYVVEGFNYDKLYPVADLYGDAKLNYPKQSGFVESIIYADDDEDASRPVLIVKWGESNAGGRALDSDAFSYEIGQRNKLKIFHNYEGVFQRLDIGVNNRIGHAGTGDWGNRHGIELQITNRQEEGTFLSTTDTVYMVAVGQGGTIVDNWYNGGNTAYESINPWDTAVQRINTAISILTTQTGKTPRVFIYYSQGLNDLFTSANTAAEWKTKTSSIIDDINGEGWDVEQIVLTKFFDDYTGYNAKMDELASEKANVSTIDTEWDTLGDLLHYDYDGEKANGNDFVNKLLSITNF